MLVDNLLWLIIYHFTNAAVQAAARKQSWLAASDSSLLQVLSGLKLACQSDKVSTDSSYLLVRDVVLTVAKISLLCLVCPQLLLQFLHFALPTSDIVTKVCLN